MDQTGVGILGLGTYLPPEVRKNDWWPESVVRKWTEKRAATRARHADAAPVATTEGMRRVLAAIASTADDPFQGAVERRVMPKGMLSSDMELHAAKEAIARSGIDPREIGVVLCNSAVPDNLVTNNACLLHHRLELAGTCMAMGTEAACNSFMIPLTLVEPMIRTGSVKYALLVQSCGVSPILDSYEPASPWFGDGATAAVIGPVSSGRGILASTHRTDGSNNRSLVAGVPNGRWYDEGRAILHSADPAGARKSFIEIADGAEEVTSDIFAKTGFSADDISFFGVHQGTPWLRKVLLEHLGLHRAQSVETFAWAASLFGCNIPLGLSIAEREGMLRDGELVLMFGGGAGITYSSMLMRWGR